MILAAEPRDLWAPAQRASRRGRQSYRNISRIFDLPGILLPDADEMIITETMSERKCKMRELSEAFITLPGGIGSFEEFFETLTLKQVGDVEGAIAVLNTEGCYDKLVEMIDKSVAEGFTPIETLDMFAVFSDMDKLLDYVEEYKPERKELWREKMVRQKYLK